VKRKKLIASSEKNISFILKLLAPKQQMLDFDHMLKFPESVKRKIMGFQSVLNQLHT